jgi:uncharacterized repeat protein (TIGR01451 family)
MKTNWTKILAVILAAQALAVLSSTVANAQGPIANGETRIGSILVTNETDSWTFSANAGDAIVVRVGEVNTALAFTPRIQLLDPSSAVLATATGTSAAEITTNAPSSGTYTVRVSDNAGTQTNSYRLTLAKSGSSVTVSPGDTGGPLTNGSYNVGVIDVGDLDVWSFTASVGESIVVRAGRLSGSAFFGPALRMYGPDGALVMASPADGYYTAEVTNRATQAGTYLVVVGDGDLFFNSGDTLGDAGTYNLTLAKTGDAIVVSPGDEGGTLTNGVFYTGTLTNGDLDVWSFCAKAGDDVSVQVTELSGSTYFDPWIRLYGPDGKLLGSSAGSATAQVTNRAAIAGSYLVIVSDGDLNLNTSDTIGDTGTYQLTATGTGNCDTPALDCSLTPQLATNTVGTAHTVIDFVTTNLQAAVGALVNFSVISGPNIGQSGSTNTDVSGQASFTYTGNSTPGTDIIRAIASLNGQSVTCTATKVWIALPPVAGFSATPTNGAAPLLVNFTDSSTGTITNRLWSFGDTGTSTLANPSHTYSNAGVYSVSLTVFGPGGLGATNALSLITVTNVLPVAGFTANPTNGAAPLMVVFGDTSTGTITNRLWTFGDGAASGGTAPTHTYTTAGVFSVSLTVFGPGGSDTLSRPSLITVTNIAPKAGFTANPTNGVAPLQVSFTDASTGTITNRQWDFGDGGASTATNPSHTYTNAGSYSVTLTVFGPTGTDALTRPALIVVTVAPPTADLELIKAGSPNPVAVTSNLAYTITVTNHGPDTATSITLTDALPASVQFVFASEPCTNDSGLVTCDLGSLNNGAVTNVTIVVSPTIEGSLTNMATVAAAETDPNPTNNTATAITTVTTTPSAATLTVNSSNPDSGVPITVSLTDNNGQSNGSTPFMRTYDNGTVLTLSAPGTAGGNHFQKWQQDGADFSSTAVTIVTLDADHTLTAVYEAGPCPDLTGTWSNLVQTCKTTKKGLQCKAKGQLIVQNIGTVDAPSSFVRFYLSADDEFDAGDTLLKQVATGTVKLGKPKKKTLSAKLATGVSGSGQFVIAVIDADNTVVECNESNHIIVFGPLP